MKKPAVKCKKRINDRRFAVCVRYFHPHRLQPGPGCSPTFWIWCASRCTALVASARPEPLALKLTLSRWPSSLCSCRPLLLPASIISKCRTILSPTHPRSGARNGSPTSESQVLESREYGGFGTMRVRQSICRPFLGRRARRRREAAAEARGCSSTWSRSSAPEFTKTAREVDSQGC